MIFTAVSVLLGILVVVAASVWLSRGTDDGRAELERAVADLSAVPTPAGATLQDVGVNACVHDDIDGDTEPTGSIDFTWQDSAADASDLEAWYFPAWREQGWTTAEDDPAVLQRRYTSYTVRARIQRWEMPPAFSIMVEIAEPVC